MAFALVAFYWIVQREKTTSNKSEQSNAHIADKQEKSVEHDYQDVDFAKKMILVDQQTMQIAATGIQKASGAQIKDLATKIYQGSEADSRKYIAWLKEWNESYLNLSDFPEMEGHDMYPTFSGMMPLGEVRQLDGLSGADFDKAFLALLVKHHEGVIELQTGKTSEGSAVKYTEMIVLREENAQKQTEQIEQIKQLQKEKSFGS